MLTSTPNPSQTLTAADVQVLSAARVPRSQWGARWAGVAAVCPDLVARARTVGASPQGVVALLPLLNPAGARRDSNGCDLPQRRCGWAKDPTAVVLEATAALATVDWVDVATCVRAGMSVPDAVAHLRAGRDMGPVRLLAALGD